MTDKEKLDAIRAEIHRLVDVRGYDREMANDMFAFMDSLPNEPVSERFAFKTIPRLLEMIESTDRAKAYIAKLADTLEAEGYSTDAKIVREHLKIMNGEKVPMATMDEEPVSKDLEEAAEDYCKSTLVGSPYIKKNAFKTGAKRQKEQLMAKAVETTFNVSLPSDLFDKLWIKGCKDGDKLLVIKKEEL